jgi:ribosomal RNA assembly protein
MFLKIPEDRIAVLIGKHGATKKKIEECTHCKIEINDNVVEITGDAVEELSARDIVKAIGRGFSPKNALKLLKEDHELIVISLAGETKNSRERIFGRIIGRSGKIRRNLEMHTDTCISVYGKTISIIGVFENANLARDAIEMIISGKSHGYVFKILKKRKMREKLL